MFLSSRVGPVEALAQVLHSVSAGNLSQRKSADVRFDSWPCDPTLGAWVRKVYGPLITAAGTALILVATLRPLPGGIQEELPFWCVLCGSQGTADALLNLLLFLPLGSGLALLHGPALAVGGSFALSGVVELIQTTLPGRHPALGDILFNTLGGAVGASVVVFRSQISDALTTPPWWLKVLAALLPPAVFSATALLSAPYFPETEYHGQWTRHLGSLSPYPGTVLSASVGGVSLPDHRLPDQEAAKEAFRSREPLRVRVVAGSDPSHLSHLFAVYDHQRWEVVLLTVQGSDLFFQRGTLSARLLLERPFLRWDGIMDVPEGDTIRIVARQEARGLCLVVDRDVRCDLPPNAGKGWRLVRRLPRAPPHAVALLSVLWLSFIALPASAVLAGTLGRGVAVGLAVGLLAVLISWWSPWLSPHLLDLVAPLPGAWAGWAIRERWLATPPSTVSQFVRKKLKH